jgi:ribulose-bisphosphate carboxylase large chain
MTSSSARIVATYHVRSDAQAIAARAEALAIEQSIELPRGVVRERLIVAEIAGRVEQISETSPDTFVVQVSLAASTMPPEAGQLMNMLFGNTSLHDDVVLADVSFPDGYARAFGGPRQGLAGLRAVVGAGSRPLTASALKPQGLATAELARLAGAMARGGLDIVKDDHGLADQAYSPFAARVPACAAAVRQANRETGRRTVYAPSLSGNLDRLREQVRLVRAEGLCVVLVAPMVIGLPAFAALVEETPDVAFLAHPSMAGAARITPDLLLGRLFRLFGADATIFPNFGGRFSYSTETCRRIAEAALAPWVDQGDVLRPAAPAPAGGMTLERVPELLDFYGRDAILLIGGSLLAAGDGLTAAAASFQGRVERHG